MFYGCERENYYANSKLHASRVLYTRILHVLTSKFTEFAKRFRAYLVLLRLEGEGTF